MDKEGPGLFINSLKVLFCSSWDERRDLFPSSYENIKKQDLTPNLTPNSTPNSAGMGDKGLAQKRVKGHLISEEG
jgi:hypothetical protein